MKYVKSFEDRYADVFFNSDTTIFTSCKNGKLEKVKEFIEVENVDVNKKNTQGYTPLILAADNNRMDVVKYLIEKGADVNYQDIYDRTALHYAAIRQYIDIVEILIEADTNWNLKDNLEFDFLEYVKYFEIRIRDKFPEKYQKYLMIKNSKKFNI